MATTTHPIRTEGEWVESELRDDTGASRGIRARFHSNSQTTQRAP
jgi:hypothetical protein